jgi:hypothetical protein
MHVDDVASNILPVPIWWLYSPDDVHDDWPNFKCGQEVGMSRTCYLAPVKNKLYRTAATK